MSENKRFILMFRDFYILSKKLYLVIINNETTEIYEGKVKRDYFRGTNETLQ